MGQLTKVFVASRFRAEGLEEIRQSVVDETNSRAGILQAVNLDDGRADDRGPVARSLDTVQDCDVLVLLLGNSYGESAAGSITEMEFDAATDAGLIVLAYELPASDNRDPRAAEFIARVREQEPRTIGIVTGEAGDAARIVSDVFAAIQRTEPGDHFDDASSHGIYGGLLREARYLGFGAEATGSQSGGEQIDSRIAEERKFAFRALRLGDPNAALDHFGRALQIFKLDWISAYCAAWLRWASSSRGDRSRAAEHAEAAIRSARELAMGDQEGARRHVASLLVRAQLARQAGDLQLAVDRLDRALAIQSFSKSVLSERLRVAAAQGDIQRACELGVDLFRRYPWHALDILPSTDLRPVHGEVEQAIRTELCGLASALNGSIPTTAQPTRELIKLAQSAYRDRRNRQLVSVRTEMSRLEALARRLDLTAPREGCFNSQEDITLRISRLAAEQGSIAADLQHIRSLVQASAEVAGRPQIQLQHLLGDVESQQFETSERHRAATIGLARAKRRLSHLEQYLRSYLRASFVAISMLFALLAIKVPALRSVFVIAVLVFLALLVPVSSFVSGYTIRQHETEFAALTADCSGLTLLGGRLGSLNTTVRKGLDLELQLNDLANRRKDLEKLRTESAHLAIDAVRARLVNELSQRSSSVSRWARVLEPSRYQPTHRARVGDATRFGRDESVGGLLADAPMIRLALVVSKSGDKLCASDLALLPDPGTSPGVIESLRAFESWLATPWQNTMPSPVLHSPAFSK
jgi:tetratricopeptide (TPR) repeat protein